RASFALARGDAAATARRGDPAGGQGHAPAQPAGAQAADQTQDLRWAGASACRSAAATNGDFVVSEDTPTPVDPDETEASQEPRANEEQVQTGGEDDASGSGEASVPSGSGDA